MGEGQWRRFQGRERKEEKYRRRNWRRVSIGERRWKWKDRRGKGRRIRTGETGEE